MPTTATITADAKRKARAFLAQDCPDILALPMATRLDFYKKHSMTLMYFLVLHPDCPGRISLRAYGRQLATAKMEGRR